jgi:hypothetical protein
MRVTLALVLVGLLGCTTFVRHRLPLAENPEPSAARTCAQQCAAGSRASYLACLDRCPGAETSRGRCHGAENRQPVAICLEEERDGPGGKVVGVLGMVALVVQLVVTFTVKH